MGTIISGTIISLTSRAASELRTALHANAEKYMMLCHVHEGSLALAISRVNTRHVVARLQRRVMMPPSLADIIEADRRKQLVDGSESPSLLQLAVAALDAHILDVLLAARARPADHEDVYVTTVQRAHLHGGDETAARMLLTLHAHGIPLPACSNHAGGGCLSNAAWLAAYRGLHNCLRVLASIDPSIREGNCWKSNGSILHACALGGCKRLASTLLQNEMVQLPPLRRLNSANMTATEVALCMGGSASKEHICATVDVLLAHVANASPDLEALCEPYIPFGATPPAQACMIACLSTMWRIRMIMHVCASMHSYPAAIRVAFLLGHRARVPHSYEIMRTSPQCLRSIRMDEHVHAVYLPDPLRVCAHAGSRIAARMAVYIDAICVVRALPSWVRPANFVQYHTFHWQPHSVGTTMRTWAFHRRVHVLGRRMKVLEECAHAAARRLHNPALALDSESKPLAYEHHEPVRMWSSSIAGAMGQSAANAIVSAADNSRVAFAPSTRGRRVIR